MPELAERLRVGGKTAPISWVDDFKSVVKRGEVVELGHVLQEDMPNSNQHPPFMFRLTKTHEGSAISNAGRSDSNSGVTVSSDMFFMGSHNGTHMDGLNHIACCGVVYPELDVETISNRFSGYSEHGMETVAPVFCRGVLLDATLLFDGEPLPPAREITKQEFQKIAEIEGVEIRAGDAVLIRTGWQRYWSDHRKYVGAFEGHPGPEREVGAWLGDIGIRVAGADTFGFDRRPSAMPVHVELMVERGINIMENMCLDDLAALKAYEFMFCALPLRILGGTGSPIRPIALV